MNGETGKTGESATGCPEGGSTEAGKEVDGVESRAKKFDAIASARSAGKADPLFDTGGSGNKPRRR